MKNTGIVRCVDELGRLVIPKEIRRQIGVSNNDPVEIFVEGECVILKKYTPLCHFCSSTEDITEFRGRNICKRCISELTR